MFSVWKKKGHLDKLMLLHKTFKSSLVMLLMLGASVSQKIKEVYLEEKLRLMNRQILSLVK